MKRKIPEAFHPGEYLKDELKARKWNVVKLARKMEQLISCEVDLKLIIAERIAVSPAMAENLGKALGTGSGIWLNLQAAYDLTKRIQSAFKKPTK